MTQSSHRIGTLQERSLHAALKDWYAQPGDQFEVRVDRAIIDIVRGDLLIEIQTRNFSAIKRKLTRLLADHPVRLVYPIAIEKWIVRVAGDGSLISRRRSPKHRHIEHLFSELVTFPRLITNPHFSLEVLFIREEEVWSTAPTQQRRSWRRKGWSRYDRRLMEVVDRRLLRTPADFRALLPATLAQPFTNKDLALALKHPRYIAQQITYCLREMGAIRLVGKRGRMLLYSIKRKIQ